MVAVGKQVVVVWRSRVWAEDGGVGLLVLSCLGSSSFGMGCWWCEFRILLVFVLWLAGWDLEMGTCKLAWLVGERMGYEGAGDGMGCLTLVAVQWGLRLVAVVVSAVGAAVLFQLLELSSWWLWESRLL